MENNFEKSTNIFTAVDNNDCVYIENYFKLGNDLSITNQRGENLLHRASRKSSCDVFELLLKLGVSTEDVNKYLETPLHVAVQFNKIKQVELLLDKGVTIDVLDIKKRTPLHIACYRGYFEIITLLLKKGAKVHTPDEIGGRPIHYSIRSGKINVLKLIIEAGASFMDIDYRKNNVLHYACMEGHDSLVPYLFEKFPFSDTKNIYGETPLHYAAKSCKKETLKYLLENNHYIYSRDIDGISPNEIKGINIENKDFFEQYIETSVYKTENDKFHMEVRKKEYQSVLQLMDKKPNVIDTFGNKPLYYAILNNDLKMVDLLIKQKASFDNLDKYGHSALLLAFVSGNKRIIFRLLDNKVNVNEINFGRNFLYTAVLRNDFQLVKALVKNKVLKEFVDDKGIDLKELALEYSDSNISKLL